MAGLSRHFSVRVLLAGVTLPILAASPGLAQTAAAPAPASELATPPSGDIVVTARRREETLSKVPVAVSAFSAADLERKSIVTTRDLVYVTPGLNIAHSGNFVPYITIRGQTRGLTGPGTPGVITYLNEVPLDTTGSLIPTFDMSNIQVLKGPQGTLFGRNATGGAILTYSKPASYELGGYGQVEYGEYNTLRTQGAINLPVIDQVLAVRLAGEFTRTDGYTHTTKYSTFVPGFVATPGTQIPTRRNFDQVNTKAGRATVRFDPTPWLHNVTVVDYLRYHGANNSVLTSIAPDGAILPDGTRASPSLVFLPTATIIASLTPSFGAAGATLVANNIDSLFRCSSGSPGCNIYAFAALAASKGGRHAYTDLDPDAHNTLFGVANTTKIELGDHMTFKNIFGYRRTTTYHNPDVDGTPMPISEVASRSNVAQYTDEAQIAGDTLHNDLKYVAGFFYLQTVPSDKYGFSTQNVNNFGGLSNVNNYSYLSVLSKAAYAQVDYALPWLLHGLGVTAGYRYTWDKSSGCAAGYTFSPFGGPQAGTVTPITKQACEAGTLPALPGAVASSAGNFVSKSHKGTYTLGVNWQASDRTLLYFVARRGYRSAGYNVPTFPAQYAAIQTFKPDVLDDIELGLKTRWALGGLSGNFTGDVFHGKDKGYQTFLVFSGTALQTISPGALVNNANLTIEGLEAALDINLARGLTVGGDLAYTNIKGDRNTLPEVLVTAFEDAGRTPPSVTVAQQPKWQANARLSYTMPGEVAGGQISFDAQFHYQSHYLSSDVILPGYHTVDARITLADLLDKRLDVSLFARNLFNEFYAAGPQAASAGLGVFSIIAAPPRQIGATVRVRFGGEK